MRLDHLVVRRRTRTGLRGTTTRLVGAARRAVRRRRHPPALRHPQHDPAADRRHLPRGRRGARPPGVRQGAVRPGRPRALRARRRLARLGRRRRRHQPARDSGSAARPSTATGTAPTASSCAGSSSASRACSPTRSCRSSSSGRRRPELHPSAGATGNVLAGAPRDRRRPARVSEWLGQSVEQPLEDVEGRVGRPERHARHRRGAVPDPQRSRPHLSRRGPSADQAHRARSRARTSGTTRRSTRSRTARSTAAGVIEPTMRARAVGRRDLLDIGCGTGFHLPRFAAEAAHGRSASSRTPTWPRSPGAAYAAAPERHGAAGLGATDLPLPDASVDVMHARWAYFFGPGCEPGLAELDRVMRRGGTRLRHRQRPDPVDVRRVVPARLPRGRLRETSALLVEHGLGAPRRSTSPGPSTSREDLEAVVRIEFAQAARRGDPRRARGRPAVDYAVNVWTPGVLR